MLLVFLHVDCARLLHCKVDTFVGFHVNIMAQFG